MKRSLYTGLVVFGTILLCVGIVVSSQRLTRSEIHVALAPLVVIPGENILSEPHSWKIRIPATATWKKLEARFGRPDYLLAVVRNGKVIECFSGTGLSAQVRANGVVLISKPVRRQPYGFSSDCSNEACLAFKANAGTDLAVVLNITKRPLDFSEDVICMPDWHVDMKDLLVGAALDENFWTSGKPISLAGALSVLMGLILIGKNRRVSRA